MASSSEVLSAVKQAWSRATSVSPERWSPERPSTGQCAVTALVLQDHLGGTIHRGMVGDESHYWLVTPEGRVLDITLDQFGQVAVIPTGPRTRDELLATESTARRYAELSAAVERELVVHAGAG